MTRYGSLIAATDCERSPECTEILGGQFLVPLLVSIFSLIYFAKDYWLVIIFRKNANKGCRIANCDVCFRQLANMTSLAICCEHNSVASRRRCVEKERSKLHEGEATGTTAVNISCHVESERSPSPFSHSCPKFHVNSLMSH